MNEFQRLEKLAERYKAIYKPGTRILMEHMGSDPRPIPDGTKGTIDHVDDLGTIHCTFDNGRRLGVIPEEDSLRTLTKDELLDEKSEKLQLEYIDKVNKEVIPCIEWIGMRNAYIKQDMTVPSDLLKILHEKFVEVYGSDHIEGDMGMLTVPGVVRANDGNTYVALLDIDTSSSGEHWGTTFFTPKGVLCDYSDNKDILNEIKPFIPYEYWYTPEFEGDCHVDWNKMDDTVVDMLDYASGQENNEVKLE